MIINLKNWLTQIKKGYLDLCILSLVRQLKEAYGFQIISTLEELDIPLKEGTLYPLLSRMTKDGLLQSRWETENIQGHPRKFYSLTKLGENTLNVMYEEYQEMNKTLDKINYYGEKNGKPKA
jgi:PadR family transcriptional regulator PadR